jgi:hypothetical protein
MIHTIEYKYSIDFNNSFARYIKSKRTSDNTEKVTFHKKTYFSKKYNRNMIRCHECTMEHGKFIIKISHNIMRVQVNLSKLIYDDDYHFITSNDLLKINSLYYGFIKYLLSDAELQTEQLIRVDYKRDYRLIKKIREFIFMAAGRNVKSVKKHFDEQTGELQSICIRSSYTRWNMYNRFAYTNIDFWKDITRIELQVYTRKYLKNWGLAQVLENYLNDNTYNLIFVEALEKLLGTGNWYRNNIISKLLNGKKNKDILISKLNLLRFNIDLKPKEVFTRGQLKQLKELNVNPIQGDINFKLRDVQINEPIIPDDTDLLGILNKEYHVIKVLKRTLNEIIFTGYIWGQINTFDVYCFNVNELVVRKAS